MFAASEGGDNAATTASERKARDGDDDDDDDDEDVEVEATAQPSAKGSSTKRASQSSQSK